ncbi:MAG TPA: YciI family protein [Woeseiaceae bacterium]|nr:YciI family protein [Woeseiaceae bacterium]
MNRSQPRKLEHLRRHPTPPPELEERIVDALKAKRLIRPATGGSAMKMQYAINAAIAIVALVAGLAAGQRLDGAGGPSAEAVAGDQYAMLLYENESYQQPEPGGMEARIGEYSQWAREVAATGKYVAGEKLTNDALLLLPDGSRSQIIPAAEQGALEGFFIISANDLEEAAAIAATCPHLRYGGAVSLRRIAG